MKSSNNTSSFMLILIISLLTGCNDDNKEYETLCVDTDTSVKNDIAEQGLLWSLYTKDLKHIISLSKRETSRNIYLLNSITTCDMTFNDVNINNKKCNVYLNAGAYGGVTCNDNSKYSFGCYEEECASYFPFPFEGYE